MSLRISAGADVKRGDLFFVDPFEVIVKEELRGRHTPPTEEDVVKRAISMLDVGQLQPVECRRVEGSKIQLTMGFTRCAAARLIRTGFTDFEGVHQQDPEFRLQVKVVDCNDEIAFLRNVVENAERNQTSPIDDAFNQQRLRDYGYDDAAIAKKYVTTATTVGNLRKLLQLPSELQTMVHQKGMSIQAALDLVSLPTEKQAEVIVEATKSNGKVDTTAVRAQVREHHLRDADNKKTDTHQEVEPTKSLSLSMRELRKYWEAWLVVPGEGEEPVDPAIRRFAQDSLKFVSGKMGTNGMDNAVNRFLDANRS